MFQNGKIVEVYEDPMTMIQREGIARIICHVREVEPGLDLYQVNFLFDAPDTIVERKIATSPLCCCTDPVHPDNSQCKVHGAQVPAHWVTKVQ